ncbi:Deoxyhypusine hydroxylase-A [Zea mays]|uniref:Deoxyhypusine hydroxylase-A n=1 Tax=Zea mays TaxID=4577 RepID=A0A3L6F4J8_MAIZE|nr:Deoxyhypusine hydroxylase-A [Zea mays]
MERFLCERLLDAEHPIAERIRAFFSLAAKDPSNLLAHEAAFALGQMQDAEAIPDLVAVLKDFSLHPIVFHEVAEALGAIGMEKSIPLFC